MAPAVVIDNTPDLDMDFSPSTTTTIKQQQNGHAGTRTLLLAPASVASHPSALTDVAEAYDRSQTDIQMLDRLAAGLVSLPDSTYHVVLILSDVDRIRNDNSRLLSRNVMERIVTSLQPGGRLKSQNGSFEPADQTEAILAGLVSDSGDGMLKPVDVAGEQTVKLSFGKKKRADAAAVPANELEAANTGKRKMGDVHTEATDANSGPVKATPAGVGFIDNDDDLDAGYDDEDDFPDDEALANAGTIDPDTLLTEEDRQKPLNIRESKYTTEQERQLTMSQPKRASPTRSVEEPARTAHAVLPSASQPKTRPSAPKQMQT